MFINKEAYDYYKYTDLRTTKNELLVFFIIGIYEFVIVWLS